MGRVVEILREIAGKELPWTRFAATRSWLLLAASVAWDRSWGGVLIGMSLATFFTALVYIAERLQIQLEKLRNDARVEEQSEPPKLTHESATNDPVGPVAAVDTKKRAAL